jgi:cytochrome c551/c552
MSHRLIVGLMILSVAFAASRCSKPAPPPPEKTAAAAQAQPSADTAARMAGHFGKVRELEQAIVRGDLESAKADARWIADHQETAGLPAGTEGYVTATRNAARAVAATASLGNAAVAAAFAVAACGECHAAAKVTPSMPEVSPPPAQPGTAAHMLEHQYAVDLMYRGLVAPSEALWKQGAEALKGSPLTDKDLAKTPKEVVVSERRVHELAARAEQAPDTGTKIAIYGELIGGCANCHAMHGRVLGPGVPKAGGARP